jgi:aminoglycoside 6'-N-acetyltransferase I
MGNGILKTRYGLEIRTATIADAVGLAELFGAAGHVIPAKVVADRMDAVRQAPGAVLIAMEWGPPSGLIVAHWYPTLDADQPTAQITTLLVGPDERRRGIGRLLIKAAAQAARVAGCDGLEILAPPAEHSLRGFCQATGFIEAGSRFVRALRKRAIVDPMV